MVSTYCFGESISKEMLPSEMLPLQSLPDGSEPFELEISFEQAREIGIKVSSTFIRPPKQEGEKQFLILSPIDIKILPVENYIRPGLWLNHHTPPVLYVVNDGENYPLKAAKRTSSQKGRREQYTCQLNECDKLFLEINYSYFLGGRPANIGPNRFRLYRDSEWLIKPQVKFIIPIKDFFKE